MSQKIKNRLQSFSWPIWFPYPSSWLRALILVPIAFPGTGLILLGFGGLLVSAWVNSFSGFVASLLLGILIPTIILAFIYQIFWFMWHKNTSSPRKLKWIPRTKSLWQGFYATTVIGLSFCLILAIALGLAYLSCKLSGDTGEEIAECTGKLVGRATGAMVSQTFNVWDFEGTGVFVKQEDILYEDMVWVRPWFFVWFLIAAYLYQIEYIFQEHLFPLLRDKIQRKNSNSSRKTSINKNVNPLDLELDQLRANMGLTEMKQGKIKRSGRRHSFPRNKRASTAKPLIITALILIIYSISTGVYYGLKTPQLATVEPVSNPSPQAEPFQEAVRKATNAAQLTQSAQTSAEWQTVAKQWQEAITLMKAVPPSHPQYNIATQKAGEYENNLQYAKENAGTESIDSSN